MDKLLLKSFQNRRIFLIGCSSESDMLEKRYEIKRLMKGRREDVEFIYSGLSNRVKPYVAERVVDIHPMIDGLYAGGKYRNYMNLIERSNLTASESLQTAIQLYQHQFNQNPLYILIIQV
jgi:hypothetical protein